MFEVSPLVAKHVHRAIEVEIARLKRIADEVGDGEWPIDFDSNDIPLFGYMLPDFASVASGSEAGSFSRSKPLRFAMELLPTYLAQNRASLSTAEIAALEEAVSRYASFGWRA
jgi:hypothetical protein